MQKQWLNALRRGLSLSINHDVSSGDNVQSHSQAKLTRSQGAEFFFGGGGGGNESKELREWKSVTAKISFMDLSGEGADTMNNDVSSCMFDALTSIANILVVFCLSPPSPPPVYLQRNFV